MSTNRNNYKINRLKKMQSAPVDYDTKNMFTIKRYSHWRNAANASMAIAVLTVVVEGAFYLFGANQLVIVNRLNTIALVLTLPLAAVAFNRTAVTRRNVKDFTEEAMARQIELTLRIVRGEVSDSTNGISRQNWMFLQKLSLLIAGGTTIVYVFNESFTTLTALLIHIGLTCSWVCQGKISYREYYSMLNHMGRAVEKRANERAEQDE